MSHRTVNLFVPIGRSLFSDLGAAVGGCTSTDNHSRGVTSAFLGRARVLMIVDEFFNLCFSGLAQKIE